MESPKNTTRFSPGAAEPSCSISIAIARELSVVVGEHGDPRGAVLIEAVKAGRRNTGSRNGLLG